MSNEITTRQDYLALFATTGDAIAFENATLGAICGQAEALQAPAIVADAIGGADVPDDHPEYWAWLVEQFEGSREVAS